MDVFSYVNEGRTQWSEIADQCDVKWSVSGLEVEVTNSDKLKIPVSDVLLATGCKGIFPLTCEVTYDNKKFTRTIATQISINHDLPFCDYGLELPSFNELFYYI